MQTLSEIVLAEELADAKTVRRAARHADARGVPLVVALVRHCEIDEVSLLLALSKQTRIPALDPSKLDVDSDALRQIDPGICRRLRVMPLLVSTGARPSVRLAMADPTDRVAIAEIEHHTGCTVDPVLLTLSAIDELLESSYRELVTEVMSRERRGFSDGAIPGDAGQTTIPHHRISDEADLETKLEALVKLLADRGVVNVEDYEQAIVDLLKSKSDQT